MNGSTSRPGGPSTIGSGGAPAEVLAADASSRASGRAPRAHGGSTPALLPLGAREAVRLLTSPAIVGFAAYLVLISGVELLSDPGSGGSISRAALAEITGYVALLMLGPLTYVATHLVASSSRRTRAEAQLSAAPLDPWRRDLGLALGVLLGPAVVATAVALLSDWLARGVVPGSAPGVDNTQPWQWYELAQVPAIVLGAGVFAIVVARWLPFPGSLLLGLVALVVVVIWVGNAPQTTVLSWLTWYVLISWWSDAASYPATASFWHTAYLLGWSAVGLAFVALRHGGPRSPRVVAVVVTLVVVALLGWLQLPEYVNRLGP